MIQRLISTLALLLCAAGLQAKIVLPPQIGDYMVLQQQTQVSLWGWADAGAMVTVTVSWEKAKYVAKAGADGAWKVAVSTPEGGYAEQSVSIACGKEKVTLQHVLIGEVWLGSGQSNMEMPLRGFDNCPIEGGPQEIAFSGRYKGRIRFNTLPKTEAYSARTITGGEWKESCPENAPEFGAAAWFFAKNLTEVLDVPVGIINNAWGGSHVEGWLPSEVVETYPDLPSDSLSIQEKIPGQWHRPTIMYYGQWAPVRNYTFKGVLWYQGESNVGQPDYALRMETLIALWRRESGNKNLPVYQVEIAPFVYGDGPDGLSGALLREQQRISARETENCWIVSTADLVFPYEGPNIHPAKKREVGERLSYLALNHTYGKWMFPGAAPTYHSMKVEGQDVYVQMDHVYENGGFNRMEAIEGFEVCGADGVWYPAQAWANGMEGVKVYSAQVAAPVAVRYAFRNWLPANLTGAKGLAVEPFRSDQ